MVKARMVLVFLTILIAVSQGQDYLDGGYVDSGNGEIGQYFTDPIFSSPGGHYVSPVSTKRAAPLGAAARQATSKVIPSVTASSVAGNWHLELTDGMSIYMVLHQSGTVIFGQGSVTSGTISQWAAGNGVISGNSLRLAVVPASGTELYVVSLDIVRPSLGGSFTTFKADGQAKSGAARGNRIA
jgi:hypothetical protein